MFVCAYVKMYKTKLQLQLSIIRYLFYIEIGVQPFPYPYPRMTRSFHERKVHAFPFFIVWWPNDVKEEDIGSGVQLMKVPVIGSDGEQVFGLFIEYLCFKRHNGPD